jgi:stage II sporulation protein P
MKITTVFLKKSKYSFLNNILKSITTKIYSLIIIVFTLIFFSKLDLNDDILLFASNIRQANNFNISIMDIKKLYPLFNENSYIVDEKNLLITKADEKNKEYELIDKNNEIPVMFNIKRNINVNSSENIDRVSIDNIKILNYSSLKDINYKGLLDKIITLTKKSDNIFIYNTHTSESYTNSEKYKFEYTGNFRSTDSKYNMISVSSKLNDNLKEKNFNVIQDTTPHDYGTYTSAYSRSKITIDNAIKSNGNFGIMLDIHRDANGDPSFRPVININGVEVAQCMFVIGVGTSKLRNRYYEENLSLAIQLQLLADTVYPGLFRPMIIRDSVYNQDMNKNSLLIEIGATGNTLDEVYYATRCISNIFSKIYKN